MAPRVLTFSGYRPTGREDGIPYTLVRVDETPQSSPAGPYEPLTTIALADLPGGVDADPAHPLTRDFTATTPRDEGWYIVVFVDDDGNEDAPSTPVSSAVSFIDPAVVRSLTANVNFAALGYPAPTAGESDTLDGLVAEAIGYVELVTGRAPLSTVPTDFAASVGVYMTIARRAVALRVAQLAYGLSRANLSQAASGVQSFSVPGYSESRGSSNVGAFRALTNAWPELWDLLWLLMTPEKREEWTAAQRGEDVPFIDVIDIDVPGAGLSDPNTGGLLSGWW